MPKRMCTFSGCKSVVEVPSHYRGSPRCDKHSQPTSVPKRQYDHHYHNGKNIYKSPEWTALRRRYVAYQPLCEHCLVFGIIKPGDIVDHIKEVEDGGKFLEWDNLQHLCHSCHNTKTGREKTKRRRKSRNKGFGNLSDF